MRSEFWPRGGAAVETQRGKTFEWLSKEGVISKHGEKKAFSKIHSKKLEDRADPDTGENTEWTKAYKLYTWCCEEMKRTKDGHSYIQDEEAEGERAVEAVAELDGIMEAMGAGSSSTSGGRTPINTILLRIVLFLFFLLLLLHLVVAVLRGHLLILLPPPTFHWRRRLGDVKSVTLCAGT